MKNRIATAVTLALVAGLAGLSGIPTAAAVGPDCNEEFLIPDSKPPLSRILLGNIGETGLEDVAAGGSEEVTVQLDSEDSRLEFGVFYLDGQTCTVAMDDGRSTCDDTEVLETETTSATVTRTCQIDAPNSEGVDFYFHVVDQKIEPLEYRIWMSS